MQFNVSIEDAKKCLALDKKNESAAPKARVVGNHLVLASRRVIPWTTADKIGR